MNATLPFPLYLDIKNYSIRTHSAVSKLATLNKKQHHNWNALFIIDPCLLKTSFLAIKSANYADSSIVHFRTALFINAKIAKSEALLIGY